MSELLLYQCYGHYPIPEKFKGEVFEGDDKLEVFRNINKINLFVGANNSGKSRIIRELLKGQILHSWNAKILEEVNYKIETAKADILQILKVYQIDSENFRLTYWNPESIFFDSNFIKNEYWNKKFNYFLSDIFDFFSKRTVFQPLAAGRNLEVKINEKRFRLTSEAANSLIALVNEKWGNTLDELLPFQIPSLKFERIYIPSMRTLKALQGANSLIQQTTVEYGFVQKKDSNDNIEIQNGEGFYQWAYDMSHAVFHERKAFERFQQFLAENFFQSKSVVITAVSNPKVVYIKIGEEKEQAIYDLGDGIQMIIILAYPFFMYKAGVISIEEPELFMHPGMQKKFLKFLLNHPITENFQVFIATHSNHFLDAVNDSELISIFNVSKRFKKNDTSEEKFPDFVIENVAFGNENSLKLLGVTNSSVYLANSTIWVEGVTDKLYIQRFIEVYLNQKEVKKEYKIFLDYQEGIHYSFVYSGGDCIVHWNLDDDSEYQETSKSIIARKLCGKSLVIVDDDGKKNTDRKDYFRALLGNRLIVLEVAEIENLLSEEVIHATIKDYPTVKAKAVNYHPVSEDDRKHIKLGSLIDSYILKDSTGVKKFSKVREDSSGVQSQTINDKLPFCEKAVKHITPENLTDEAKNLVQKILDFVIAQNEQIM